MLTREHHWLRALDLNSTTSVHTDAAVWAPHFENHCSKPSAQTIHLKLRPALCVGVTSAGQGWGLPLWGSPQYLAETISGAGLQSRGLWLLACFHHEETTLSLLPSRWRTHQIWWAASPGEFPSKRSPPIRVAGTMRLRLESGSQLQQGKKTWQLVMASSKSLEPLSYPHHNGKKKVISILNCQY